MSTLADFDNRVDLYQTDETAWLDMMATYAASGRTDLLDCLHNNEYLRDMANRDRHEVVQRLMILLVHLLKWEHQPDKRSRSWELTIREQSESLGDQLESATLRRHAEIELEVAYGRARRRAAVEMDCDEAVLPEACPYSLDEELGE